MREDVVGRANVEDTPELDRYYGELGRQESYALWTVANSIEPWQPQPTSQPQLWSYRAMRPLVLQALDLVSPEKAGRRVIALENPGRKGTSACVGWLYTGLQVMRPGEFATAVRRGASMTDGEIVEFVQSRIRALTSAAALVGELADSHAGV